MVLPANKVNLIFIIISAVVTPPQDEGLSMFFPVFSVPCMFCPGKRPQYLSYLILSYIYILLFQVCASMVLNVIVAVIVFLQLIIFIAASCACCSIIGGTQKCCCCYCCACCCIHKGKAKEKKTKVREIEKRERDNKDEKERRERLKWETRGRAKRNRE